MYFDDLARSGISDHWGVTGVSLNSPNANDLLSAQDGLYTVVQRGHDRQTARVVGSIGSVHYAPSDGTAVRAALADPQTRIVSLTITNNGYFLNPVTDEFDADHPDVRADLVASQGYATAWGYLAEALDRRRRAGVAPFTVLCCDNIPGDTRPARTALVSFAALKDPGWPGGSTRMSRSRRRWSIASPRRPRSRSASSSSRRSASPDRFPVVTEPYRQWVIEDSFCNWRPPLEEVGAEFVADVSDHKLIKTRLLNGSHIALGCLATLAGYRRTDEPMRDRVLVDYVERLLRDEVQPLLPAVPGMNIPNYRATLLARLGNPRMSDQLSRLARRGTSKIAQFVMPSLREAIARGRPHTLLMLAVAGWARYMRGHDLSGRKLSLENSQAIPLVKLANMASSDPDPLLGHEMFAEVRGVPGFAERLHEMIADIDERGVVPTLRDAMRNDERELVSR